VTASVAGLRVLVVEDDYLIGADMADMLETAGAVVIGPIGRVEDALALLAEPGNRLDCAILDLDLHGSPSYPIVDALLADHVPVLFATGFSVNAIADPYRGLQRLEKPVDQHALLTAVAGIA
jgi:DNA-binding response OmpR family regulator